MKLERYLNKINDTTHRLGVGNFAYRGQSKADWPLHSAATRRLRRHRGEGIQNSPEFSSLYLDYHKSTLISPARTQGFDLESGREISDLQLLAKLQHLGAATGLLDFSWDPLVALWFACRNPDQDGTLFVINTNDPIQVGMISSDESEQGVETVFMPNGEFPKIAYWEPKASGDATARILRQRSVFVIGRPNMPEDSDIVGEVKISKGDKAELVRELGLLDVSQRSLFLDAHGFAENNSVARPVLLSQDDYLVAGNRHYQRGEFQYAIEAYGRFVDLNPDSSRVYFLKANAHAELRDHTEAIEDYDKAINKMTQSPQGFTLDHMVYFNRANSKVELGHYKEAILDYTQAIAAAPDPTQYYFNLANTYADALRFEEAIATYEMVGFANWHAIFNKGNVLMCLGRFSEALACYAQAASQTPNDETANQNVWTASRLINLLTGIEFTHHFDASRMYLQIYVADTESVPELHQYTYMIAGRAGNVGNSGYMQAGGQGFAGKGPIMIAISRCDEGQGFSE